MIITKVLTTVDNYNIGYNRFCNVFIDFLNF